MNSIGNVKEEKCFGCGACFQICPQKCIVFIENERGFLIPKKEEEKCINCGLCKKSCPYENESKKNEIKESYAAISNYTDIIKISTSGGIFLHLAKYILLQEKGVVFGCSWNKNNEVIHIKVTDEKDLIKLSQSKYVQSNTKNTFIQVRESLQKGKKVLYSGTACQIDGLKKFLGRMNENLYTIEVACHGVPSPGLFKRYLQWFEEKEKKKIESFSFRNKIKHKTGEHFMFEVKYNDGKKKYYYANEDPYYESFLKAKILRKTCYDCKYKGKERISDITLSDYWGIHKEHKKFPAQNGASAIMISTLKGKALFEKIISEITYEKTNFESISKHNKSLIESPSINNLENYIIDDDIFNKIKPIKTLKGTIKNMIPGTIKYYIKRIR